jgi:lipopolysaccharide export system permease protein
MKVLTRYLLRAHIGPFLFAFVALTGVILINTLAKSMAELAGKGLPLGVVLEFFVLSLPANIALTLPMSMLVAVLYTFSTLAAENEITALKASGIDLKRMVLPLLAAAAMIAGGMIWFNDRVLPEANYRWRMLMVDVAQTSPLLALQEQVINPIQTSDGLSRYYLQAGEIEAATGRMFDVSIYAVSAQHMSRTIYADDGHMREADFSDPLAFQQVAFERQVMRMKGVSQRLERSTESSYRTDRDMNVAMMQARIDTLRAELVTLRESAGRELPPSAGEPTTIVGGEVVRGADARIRGLEYQIREYQVEIQKKFSIAVATLVFVVIGVPLALRFPRGGVGMVIAASLGIFGIYYVGLIGGETLGDEGIVPPAVAMWLTNLLFALLGVWGLSRLGREFGSTRGSGWGDRPRWLRLPALTRARRQQAEGAS